MATNKESHQATDAGLKRSIARRFNDALAGRKKLGKVIDRRNVRKLNRYRNELKNHKKQGNKPLSPLEVAERVHVLLESGDKMADIRKLAKPRVIEYNEEMMAALVFVRNQAQLQEVPAKKMVLLDAALELVDQFSDFDDVYQA